MISHCSFCGFDNPPGMKFCGNCGARLSAETLSQESSRISRDGSATVLESLYSQDQNLQAGLRTRGQRRNVTVLFVDLCDYTGLAGRVEDDDLFDFLTQYIRMLSDSVNRYEGVVDKIIGDGLMAIFGAPIAFENTAERGVRAALDMLAGMDELNQRFSTRFGDHFHIHIGLHNGTVIIGDISSGLKMEYTAIGDTVNLACRLQEAAPPDTVLVSEKVWQSTHALFNFRPYSDLALKGISQPVRVYALIGPRENKGNVRGLDGVVVPMIGREEELAILRRMIAETISDHRGRIALVIGEAGIGKTRLTAELKSSLDREEILILQGQSLTYRRSVSYWIFIEVLLDYLQTPPGAERDVIHRRLISKVQPLLSQAAKLVLPYLEYLLSLEHSDEGATHRLGLLNAEQLRQQTFLAMRAWLEALAVKTPVLIILEDLHWADDVSLDLLSYLVTGIDQFPIMILALSRPDYKERLIELARHGGSHLHERLQVVQLHGLSARQSEQLLVSLLSGQAIPQHIRAGIISRANGIPFFIEEMLRMYIDQGVIFQENGVWKFNESLSITEADIPQNLQDLILTRVDRLNDLERQVLKVAAVIGRNFTSRMLGDILGEDSLGDLKSALENLIDKAFIDRVAGRQEEEFAFRHILTADALYRTLLREDRKRLHRAVGEAIERIYADRLDGQIEVLAGHFIRTDRLDKALHYLLQAGHKSIRDYANLQARKYFMEADALLSKVEHTPEQEQQVWIGFGDVLTFIGEYNQAREYYQSALNSIEKQLSQADVRIHSMIHRKIAQTHERQGNFEVAERHLVEASRALGKTAYLSPSSKAEILNDLGWIHFLRGNFAESERILTSGLALVEGSEKYDVVASLHNRLGALAYQRRAYDEAIQHVSRSLALREMFGDLSGVARLHNNLGLLSMMAGKFAEAEEYFFQGINLLKKVGDAEGIVLANINIGLVKFDRGDLSAARTFLEEARLRAEQIGHRFYLALACLYLGRLKSALEQFQESEKLLEFSYREFEALGSKDNLIDTIQYIIENSLASGMLSKAETLINEAQQAMKDKHSAVSDSAVQLGRLLRLQGMLARQKGDYPRAREALLESKAILESASEKLETGRTCLELGYVSLMQGNASQALADLNRARSLFQQLGAKRDLAKVNHLIRRVSLAHSDTLIVH